MEEPRHEMLQAKRSSRGKRMASLIGKAVEEDDAFWGHSIWEEDESGNESYSEEEIQPDEFDTDFGESETEDESDSEEEKEVSRRVLQKSTTSLYKDPKRVAHQIVRKAQQQENAEDGDGERQISTEPKPKKRKREASDEQIDLLPRTLRETTKSKTVDADIAREKRIGELQKRFRPIKVEKPQFNQWDMLKESLDTEETNATWVSARKFLLAESGEDGKRLDRAKKKVHQEYLRFYSKRMVPPTITFSTIDLFEKYFPSNRPEPVIPPKICVITGLPAKYRDPKTMLPYANLEAYEELKRRYHHPSQQQQQRIRNHPSSSSSATANATGIFTASSASSSSSSTTVVATANVPQQQQQQTAMRNQKVITLE